jgi:hypothetical protein
MATMRHGLSDFLVRLVDEPDLLEEYIEDRSAVMEREGLGSQDRDAIMTGDLLKIRARLRTQHPDVHVFNSVMEPEPPKPPEPPEPEPKPEPEPPTPE